MAQPWLDITAALVRASGLVSDICAKSAAEHEVTAQQAQLLCVLAQRPVAMAELGVLMRITKSSTTGLVDRAQAAGLVVRDADADDRRSHLVSLTERGRRLGGAYRAMVTERITTLIADVPDAERELLRAVLSQVVISNQARATWPAAPEQVA